MKNIYRSVLVLLFISLFSNNLFSKGVYISGDFGYAGPMASQSAYNYTRDDNSRTYDVVNISLGKGINLGGSVGYMLNGNIGVDVGFSYLYGLKIDRVTQYPDDESISEIYSSSTFRLNPSLVLGAEFKKFNPYTKVGFQLGKGSFLVEMEEIFNGTTEIIHAKYSGGVSFGFTSSIGILYKITDKIGLYGEFNLISSNYSPSKGEIILYTIDGVDELDDLDVRDRETEFLSSYTEYGDANSSDSEPDTSTKTSYPNSSFGINMGLKFSF